MTDLDLDSLATGRRRARAGEHGPVLMARDFFRGAVPDHPDVVDNTPGVGYNLGKNDRFGTCVPTCLDNYIRTVSFLLTGTQRSQGWPTIKAWYMEQNPGFNEDTGAGDEGMYMQQFLASRVKAGNILGFAAINPDDDDSLTYATYLFGGTLEGQVLQRANMDQFRAGQPWDYVSGSPEAGGHATTRAGYNRTADRQTEVTWSRPQSTTDGFRRHALEEVYVVVLPEHVAHPGFRAGYDLTRMADAFADLTGRPFPVDVTNLPPAEEDPDRALAAAAGPYLASRTSTYTKPTRDLRDALITWAHQKGITL